jgi:hypothetical protein
VIAIRAEGEALTRLPLDQRQALARIFKLVIASVDDPGDMVNALLDLNRKLEASYAQPDDLRCPHCGSTAVSSNPRIKLCSDCGAHWEPKK